MRVRKRRGLSFLPLAPFSSGLYFVNGSTVHKCMLPQREALCADPYSM
jgi:hypothetical protein